MPGVKTKKKFCARSPAPGYRCRLNSSVTSHAQDCLRNEQTHRCRYIGVKSKKRKTRGKQKSKTPTPVNKMTSDKARKIIREHYFHDADELDDPRAQQELTEMVNTAVKKNMTEKVIVEEVEHYAKGYGMFADADN